MNIKINKIQGDFDGFGYSTALGDVNGDGVNELIVSSPNDSNGASIKIYSTQSNKLIKSILVSKKKVNTLRILTADINLDQVDEIIVAITYQDLSGEVKIISLKNNKIIRRFKSLQDYDAFGFSIAIGDVNGDQIPDIVVGAPQPIKGGKGKVYVFSGETGELIREFNSRIPRGSSDFGTSLACADINQDGLAEIIIGAPGLPHGEVYVYSVKQGWLLYKLTGEPGFGVALHVDDINNDGLNELIVTTKDLKGNKVSLYHGPYFRHLFDIKNEEVDIGFGEVIATSDINGDGTKELILGAFDSHHQRQRFSGQVNVYSGKNAQLLHRWYGKNTKEQFGFSITTGKVSSNSHASVVIGAPKEMLKKNGLLYIVSLAPENQD